MVVTLKPVLELSPSELDEISASVRDHKDFTISEWYRRDLPYRPVFAAFRGADFVGMCCWSGMPHRAQPYIWIHPSTRRQGCGSGMVDALAVTMKALGVTGIAPMPIVATGRETETAMRLAARLRSHFRDQK